MRDQIQVERIEAGHARRAVLEGEVRPLAGTERPQDRLKTVWDSERPAQFRAYRPEDADRDLSLCLTLDSFTAVPRIRLEGDVGIVDS